MYIEIQIKSDQQEGVDAICKGDNGPQGEYFIPAMLSLYGLYLNIFVMQVKLMHAGLASTTTIVVDIEILILLSLHGIAAAFSWVVAPRHAGACHRRRPSLCHDGSLPPSYPCVSRDTYLLIEIPGFQPSEGRSSFLHAID